MDQPQRDTLTIGRLLLLTAGVAIGLGVFVPQEHSEQISPLSGPYLLSLYNALLIGSALPAPFIVLGQRLRKGPAIGPGGLFAVTMGLGSLLMLPPVLVARLQGEDGSAMICLYYALPLVSFWYLASALITGAVSRQLLSRATPWTEKYGFLLAALWAPLGIWWLITVFYAEAFQ